MRRLILLAALLALVATACKIETNFGANIRADGSGTIVAEVGMDEEAQGFLLSGGTDPFEGNDLADCVGARTSEENRGDLHFWIIECDVDDITEFETTMTDTDNTFLESFDITVTDTLVSVSGRASADETLGEEAGEFDPAVFEDAISANLRITMPGRILDHNADSQDGNTLVWVIPVLGGTLDVSASSDPTGTPASGGGGGGIPTWLIAVIVVVVLAGLYYLYMQNKKKGGGASAADAPPAAPTA
ncbi:MAG TPA: hypothetical protein VFY15_04490 [Acidimicrobiia bacterium]|nr:hypothetical protein [Acidimicrobiia bacterium]